MAFAPVKLDRTQPSRKRALFGADAPNYQDFSTPPNGDFVRYVDGLMQWSEQEQERIRLKALGDKARSTTNSEWGRTTTEASHSMKAVRPVSAPAQPGSAETTIERFKRKAQDQVAKLQQALQAGQKSASSVASKTMQQDAKSASVPAVKVPKGLPMVLVFAAFVAAGIFAPVLLPVAIIGWVVFNVIRAVRAASSSKSS